MKSNKFNLISVLVVLFFIAMPIKSHAIEISTKEGFKYKITESETSYINKENTTAHISVNGTEQQEDSRIVTLPRIKYIPPDTIKFVGGEGSEYDFVVLNEEDLAYYAFDGDGYTKVNSLSLGLDNPYGVAVSHYSGAPSYFISNKDSEGNGEVVHYMFDSSNSMIKSPLLNTGNIKAMTGITVFTETNDLGLTTEDAFKFYVNTGSSYEQVIEIEYESPMAIAAGQSGYNFAILSEDKVERYMFDGSNFLNIPMLEIAIDQEIMGEVRNVVVDDITDTTYLLTNEQLRAYTFDDGQMSYNAVLSLDDELESPQAIAFNHKQNGLMIIDYVNDESYQGKYYMLNENGEYINVPHLSMEDMNSIVTKITPEYRLEGILEFNEFITEKEIDLIRVRAYTETPRGTKITFQYSNSTEEVLNEDTGETIEGDVWNDLWIVENGTSDIVSNGSITKYSYEDEAITSLDFGDNSRGYPSFDKDDYDYSGIEDYDVGGVDENGNIIISYPTNYKNSLWSKIPDKSNLVKIRVVLSTIDETVTPRLFVPVDNSNNSSNVAYDTKAIHIEMNDAPRKPIIDEVEGEAEGTPQTPGEDEFEYEPEFSHDWIYTTTPNLKWRFEIPEDGEDQSAYQVLLLANTLNGWEVVYNTGFTASPDLNYAVPLDERLFYNSDAYQFAMAVRVWDEYGGISQFSDTKTFKVLAYEFPRIANIVNAEYGENEDESIYLPKINDKSTHRLIRPEHTVSDLLNAKAGSQVTVLMDSVGPIGSPPNKNVKFYVEMGGVEIPLTLVDSKTRKSISSVTTNNTWMFNFYTRAPITEIPNGTLVKARFAGKSHSSENGGTTVFYMPNYSDGIIVTNDTIYSDWQIVIQGRDRN